MDVKDELLILRKSYSKWRKSSGVEEYNDNNNFYLYIQSANQKPPTTTSGNPNSFIAAPKQKKSSENVTGNNTTTFKGEVPEWLKTVFDSIDEATSKQSSDIKNIKVQFTHVINCVADAERLFSWIANLADGEMKNGEIMFKHGMPCIIFSRDYYYSLQKYLLNREKKAMYYAMYREIQMG